MKTLPLAGYRSYWAMLAYQKLLLGLKMLPAYMAEDYETFYDRAAAMPAPDQERLIREAVAFVPLDEDEIKAVLAFACDANGIAIGEAQLKGMGPKAIMEAMVAVFMELARIKVDFVSEAEKKK